MRTMLTTMSDDGLEQLRAHAGRVKDLEREIAVERSARDEEIARVCSNGTSERTAARAAAVSPSYAHRAAKHGRFARRLRA